ncbi:MAG: hypothetical protein Q7K42_00705 [Candidatus Diapherotrites archaeon]|nr:hypothetical protein [Candidatus Diapherotrites archaeon]
MNYSFSWAMQYLKKGMMMEFSEERFIAVGENEIILGTIALLKNKTSFYKKFGFKKEGVMKDQFKKGENITIMSRFI